MGPAVGLLTLATTFPFGDLMVNTHSELYVSLLQANEIVDAVGDAA